MTAAWRRRFLAPSVSTPLWALDAPDRLMYRSNASGKWELHTWDRTTGVRTQATERPEGTLQGAIDRTGKWVWWFDDERGNELGRWMIQPFAGGEARVAAPDVPQAYTTGLTPCRSFAVMGLSLMESGTRVYIVQLGARSRLIYQHRQWAGEPDVSRDESLICLTHAERGDMLHPALRVFTPTGRTVADLDDGPECGLTSLGWSPVAGDNRLLVLHERRDAPALLVWSAQSGDLRELPIDLQGDVEGADWYPDASEILVRRTYRGRSELYRYNLSSESLRRIPTGPGTVRVARVRPNGEVWYGWSSSSAPPEVRAGDGVLFRPPGDPAPAGVAYSDHDVAGVHFFIAEPERPRPHPTIFMVHGGPTAADLDIYHPAVQAWVDHGFAVLLVNYRGSTGYGRAWRDALQGDPGFPELKDIAAAHDWVHASGIADPARVILSGESWGGYLTLLGLGVQPERWSLGIAAIPMADCAMAYEDVAEPLQAYFRALFGGPPSEVQALYAERSPLTHAGRIRVPVMILAGENDPRCPIRQIEHYTARLEELGKPYELYRFNLGHGSAVVQETVRQVEAQIAFAARCLGTPAPE
ncbi:MAG: S9 family peptidase [Chloroflexota bacterium]|nr:S9 family peptidase [Chloroflexota bacterium]